MLSNIQTNISTKVYLKKLQMSYISLVTHYELMNWLSIDLSKAFLSYLHYLTYKVVTS